MDVQDGLLHDAMVKAKTRLNVSWTISSSSRRLFSHQMELIPPSRDLERRYCWYCDADRLGEDPYVLAEVRLPRELVSSHRTSLEDRKLILSTFIYARSKLLVLALIQQTNPASQHRSLPLNRHPHLYEIPFICIAPSISGTQSTLCPANNSAPGFASVKASASSMTPTLTMTNPGNDSPVRKSVVPQSPQKELVMVLPVSPVVPMVLGLPDTRVKADSGMAMLVL